MKNIGFVVYDISLTGGAERVALNMAEEFSRKYNVHMISLFSEKQIDTDRYPFCFHVLNDKTVNIPTHLFSLSRKLRQIIVQEKIDIVFAITAGIITVATLALRHLDTKLIYCEHSNLENKTYGKKHELRQWIGAKYSDKIVTLTERDKNNFIKKYKLKDEKVTAIPNWFDARSGSDSPYNISSKLIITAGRLEQVKGYDMLVKAAAKVHALHPDWHWDIYGEGSYRPKIEKWIADAGLGDFITLKGNVKDISDRYRDYSLFVMSSYYEGLPLVLLEAQVASLPIVSFDCPTGPAEIISENRNGYLVPAYDTDILADRITDLIENEQRRAEFASNSKINLDNFSKESVLQKWFLLIEND